MTTFYVILIILNLIALVYFLFPPKKINCIYGYRTSKTLASNSIFEFANKVASKYFLLLSLVSAIINFLFFQFNIINLNILAATTLFTLVLTIVLTEIKLKSYDSTK